MTEIFPLHDETTAPEAAREALADTRRSFGMIPNLERVMATAPALLATYSAGWAAFDETALTPVERQVVYQTANFENECEYCVPWHSYLADDAKMAPADIEALRTGAALDDPKLETLRRFARALIHTRGKIAPAELEAFFEAGYDARQALEVVLGLAIKTMSNFTNSIAGTPLDEAVRKLAWEKPKIAMREGAPKASGEAA
jgi:alkylhydroperoxidase family enzyme